MAIPYGSSTAVLQGISADPVDCSLIQLFQIDSDSQPVSDESNESLVKIVLEEFTDLFAEPTELPPR